MEDRRTLYTAQEPPWQNRRHGYPYSQNFQPCLRRCHPLCFRPAPWIWCSFALAISGDLAAPFSICGEKNLKTGRTYIAESHRFKLLLGTLMALVIADGRISRFLIVENRFAEEMNPLLQPWIAEDAFMLMKVVVSFLGALALWHMYKRRPGLSFTVTSSLTAFYTVLIFWSLSIPFSFGLGDLGSCFMGAQFLGS